MQYQYLHRPGTLFSIAIGSVIEQERRENILFAAKPFLRMGILIDVLGSSLEGKRSLGACSFIGCIRRSAGGVWC